MLCRPSRAGTALARSCRYGTASSQRYLHVWSSDSDALCRRLPSVLADASIRCNSVRRAHGSLARESVDNAIFSSAVLRGGLQEGLLMLKLPEQSFDARILDSARSEPIVVLSRGFIFYHEERQWVCLFQLGHFWFAIPTEGSNISGQWSNHVQDSNALSESLGRATPTQAERVQLCDGLSTGIVALDVLAPIGRGQSLFICGPNGSGKTAMSCDIVEQFLSAEVFDAIVAFCTDPGAPPLPKELQSRCDIARFVAKPIDAEQPTLSTTNFLEPLFNAVAAGEKARDSGRHALVVLDSLAPLIDAWDLAVKWADSELDNSLDPELVAGQRRNLFANLFERAANLNAGGSLTLLATVETDALAAMVSPGGKTLSDDASDAIHDSEVYDIAQFAGRKESELERLRRLQQRGVPLTPKALSAVGISLPVSVRDAPRRDSSLIMRELQSLSDGQVVLDKAMAEDGVFPAVVPGATFSRFGLGTTDPSSKASVQRDIRPTALQAVAAHLRVELALEHDSQFRPPLEETASAQAVNAMSADAAQSTRMAAVKAVLLQPRHTHLKTEEMVAMLLVACSGAFDRVPQHQVARMLRGGAHAPLVRYLHDSAPQVLQKIRDEPRISKDTARELDVAVRLFVALQVQ